MACHLFGAKPLPEPTLAYCQLDSWQHISVKFELEFYHFHSRKCNWKFCLPKRWPFCPGGDELTDTRVTATVMLADTPMLADKECSHVYVFGEKLRKSMCKNLCTKSIFHIKDSQPHLKPLIYFYVIEFSWLSRPCRYIFQQVCCTTYIIAWQNVICMIKNCTCQRYHFTISIILFP